LVDPPGELYVDIVEGALEWGDKSTVAGNSGGGCRAQDSVVGAGEEQRGAPSEVGDAVAEAFGLAFAEAVETQAAQLIGRSLGDLVWGAAGQGGKMAAQIIAPEAIGDLAEQRVGWARRPRRGDDGTAYSPPRPRDRAIRPTGKTGGVGKTCSREGGGGP
jgi:hypothetical protein